MSEALKSRSREGGQQDESPLSFVEASDHHSVPQRVHLAAPVVHHSGEPRVDRLRAVAVAVAKQLLIYAAPKTQSLKPARLRQPRLPAPAMLTPSAR